MTAANKNLEITLPKNQIELFGYEYFFNSFMFLVSYISIIRSDDLPIMKYK